MATLLYKKPAQPRVLRANKSVIHRKPVPDAVRDLTPPPAYTPLANTEEKLLPPVPPSRPAATAVFADLRLCIFYSKERSVLVKRKACLMLPPTITFGALKKRLHDTCSMHVPQLCPRPEKGWIIQAACEDAVTMVSEESWKVLSQKLIEKKGRLQAWFQLDLANDEALTLRVPATVQHRPSLSQTVSTP